MDLRLPPSSRHALLLMAARANGEVPQHSAALLRLWHLETDQERAARLNRARLQLLDPQQSTDTHVSAVTELSQAGDVATLARAAAQSTPRVRTAILDALLGRQDRYAILLDAIEEHALPSSLLTAVQRTSLVEAADASVRKRAEQLFRADADLDPQRFGDYLQALRQDRDPTRGEAVFRSKCASCHQAHGQGHAVGPDLNAEFRRAEETILQDVLTPSATISEGFVTYAVVTTSGQVVTGLLAAESPTSVTLRQAEGKEQLVLRKDIDQLKALPVSLMPDDLTNTVSPAGPGRLIGLAAPRAQRPVKAPVGRALLPVNSPSRAPARSASECIQIAGQFAVTRTNSKRERPLLFYLSLVADFRHFLTAPNAVHVRNSESMPKTR